jgi:hypothetical protein
MRNLNRTTIRSYIKCLILGAVAITGCGQEESLPQIDLVDKSSKALTTSTVRAIKGTYGAGCINRTGSWALGLNGFSPSEDALSVVKNNSACVLSVTEVHAGTLADPEMYAMAAPLALDASYQASGQAFMLDGTGDTVFYANLRIQPNLTFSTDFTLQMVYSDDATEVTASKTAQFTVQSSSASESNVAPPNYTISLAGLTIQTDAEDVVQSATGSAQLSDVSVNGEKYVIDLDTLPAMPTFAEIDALFTGGTQHDLTGSNPTIPVADFAIGGIDLTVAKKRNIIVANIENGTRAYQIFRVTFNRPVVE